MAGPRHGRGGWFRELWADLRESTDANLLGVPRFLGLLYGPIDPRLRIDEALRKALARRLPAHVTWRHAFGGLVYLLFMVLVVTGVLLAVYYRPSADEAYASVQHIATGIPLGWLVRDLHVWSASLIVLLGLIHMGRVFLDRAYGSPRETNWLAGVLLLFVILAFGATGYLLPWDQWAYWTVTELLAAVRAVPVLGPLTANLLTGDVAVSGATLSRYFALHVIVLPWVAFWLLALHFALVRKHGIAPPATGAAPTGEGVRFFPQHLLRSFTAAVLALAATATLAILFPRTIGPPANPYEVPDAIVLTWVPVSVSLALVRYLGTWGLAAFTLLGASLALVPVFEREASPPLRRRPLAAALAATFVAGFLAAWAAGQRIDTPSPDLEPVLGAPSSAASGAPATPAPRTEGR
jgi:quinol-cytochrome oxidoreductase complex cytochrome b subunit